MVTQQPKSAGERYLSTFNKPNNVIVDNGAAEDGDAELFFGPEKFHTTNATTYESLLVELGYYGSLGEARRNGKSGPIELGYHEYTPCKDWNHMKFTLYIFNPEKATDNDQQ